MDDSALIHEPMDVYFIWTKTGHPPRFAHKSYAEALTEVERLAVLMPGKKFIIMRAVDKVHVAATPQVAEEIAA